MNYKKMRKQIKYRKKIINLLLIFLSPSNILMVALSQNLDKHIVMYQKYLHTKHMKKKRSFVLHKLSA